LHLLANQLIKNHYILILVLALVCQSLNAQNVDYDLVIHQIDSDNSQSQKIIDRFVPFASDSISITNQLNNLVLDLHENGFISASIDSVRYDFKNITAYLFVGTKYKIQNLEISSNDMLSDINKKPYSRRKKNIAYSIYEVNEVKKQIITNYENTGYPFARIVTENILFNDSIINIKLRADKGTRVEIDSIYIKGDIRIKPHYIYRYIDIKPTDAFSQSKIDKIDNRIKNLSFLDQIKPAALEFRERKADLYLYLKKKRANQFNGIIGFLPASDKSDKLVVTGDLSLGLVNSFGRGEEIGFRWEKLESSTQKLDVNFHYPYMLGSPFGIDMNFNLYKQDSSFLNLSYMAGLRWYATTGNSLTAYYRYKSSSVIGEIANTNNLADISTSLFGVSFNYRGLDYLVNPRKGVDLHVFGGVGTKDVKKYFVTDDTLKTNKLENFTEIEAGLNFDGYFPVYGNFVFHFGNITRYTGQFNEKGNQANFYENEMSRFGGARSLRGFDENAFSASIYSLQNVELRYLFEQNSAFYLFWNGAYYYQPLPEKTTEDFPWGFGIGLNFDTRAGIFSISYAIGKQFDNPIEMRTAKIHFGYISRF